MKFPVKLNRSAWPGLVTRVQPSATDPRVLCQGEVDKTGFSDAVSTFRFGTTFKSTQKERFPNTIFELSRVEFSAPPVILDVGASDGSTSLDILQALPFEKYYVTDLNVDVYYQVAGPGTWFYDECGNCILMVTDRWVIYPDYGGGVLPFNLVSQAIFRRAPKFRRDSAKIQLINPAVLARKDDRIVIERYNVFDPWPHQKADLIVAANILNQAYFSVSQLEVALNRLQGALQETGRIAIIDNRHRERASIFRFAAGGVCVEKRVNGGTEIEALALETFEADPSARRSGTG